MIHWEDVQGRCVGCVRALHVRLNSKDRQPSAQLLTAGAITAVAEHAAGNCRSMMDYGNDLLHAAVARDARQIDEKLFFDVFAMTPPEPDNTKRRR
jgi:hypothetical protein